MPWGFAGPSLLLGGLVAGVGCAARPVRFVSVPPATAQAISLLGDTLWNLPLDPDEGRRRVQLLQRARQEAADRPNNTSVQILLARRTAQVGRFREAVGLYNDAMAANPADPRLPRRRGEMLLRVRELELAANDLAAAARRSLEGDPVTEYNDLPGGGLVETSLQFSSLFFLGMAHYLQGDYGRSRGVHQEALKRARNADEVASAAIWLFFATRRMGLAAEVAELLRMVNDEMPVVMAGPEHLLLLAYRGDISRDSLPLDFTAPLRTESDAMYGYGIGFALLMLDRVEEAQLAFHRVLETPDWSALPYLAAEAELARMRRPEAGNRLLVVP